MPPPETAFAWHAASPTTRTLSAYVRRGKPSGMPPAMYRIGCAPFVSVETRAPAIPRARRWSLGARDCVGALPSGIRRNRRVEHGPLNDDRLRAMAIDYEPSTRGRVELGAMDRADDRLLAVHVFEDPRGDDSTARDRLPVLSGLFDNGIPISVLLRFPR